MDTVQEFLGVPVQNYLRIDFDVFVKIVDEINGINITPDQDMSLPQQRWLSGADPGKCSGHMWMGSWR